MVHIQRQGAVLGSGVGISDVFGGGVGANGKLVAHDGRGSSFPSGGQLDATDGDDFDGDHVTGVQDDFFIGALGHGDEVRTVDGVRSFCHVGGTGEDGSMVHIQRQGAVLGSGVSIGLVFIECVHADFQRLSGNAGLNDFDLEQGVLIHNVTNIVSAGFGDFQSGNNGIILCVFAIGYFGLSYDIAIQIINADLAGIAGLAALYPPNGDGCGTGGGELNGILHGISGDGGLATKAQALGAVVAICKRLFAGIYFGLCAVVNGEIVVNDFGITIRLVALGKGSQISGCIQHISVVFRGECCGQHHQHQSQCQNRCQNLAGQFHMFPS